DTTNQPSPTRFDNATLTFSSGGNQGAQGDVQIEGGANINQVFGSVNDQHANINNRQDSGRFNQTTGALPDRGIGTGITIATDNSVGGFSPFSGRIYVAYVVHPADNGNQGDNTDIAFAFSDNGGAGFTGATSAINNQSRKITDDLGLNDGFSEGVVSD